jgi:catechol 2,3-dioxygenase-like lactoylglutathione lyase family enzyme
MELIHTCYRITDPERSVAFYEALGFEKRRELPSRTPSARAAAENPASAYGRRCR